MPLGTEENRVETSLDEAKELYTGVIRVHECEMTKPIDKTGESWSFEDCSGFLNEDYSLTCR